MQLLQLFWQAIVKIWDITIYIPIINLLYIILAFTPNLGVAIIILSILIRALLMPTSYHQLKTAKLGAHLQKQLNRIKKKHLRKKKRKELYKKHKFNPLSSIGILILSIPIMIALYRVVPLAQKGISALLPFIYPITHTFVHKILGAEPSTIYTTLFGVDLSAHPTLAILILLALSAILQSALNITYISPQSYQDVFEQAKTQFKIPDAKDSDYHILAKTLYYGKYLNALISGIFMAWIFKALPTVFSVYIFTINMFNVVTLPILNVFAERAVNKKLQGK